MRPDNATRFGTKTYAATGAASAADMRNYGRLLATEPGINISVPSPVKEYATTSREFCVVNDVANTDPITVSTATAAAISGATQLMLNPGERVDFEGGAKVGGYNWDLKGKKIPTAWKTWTSTLTWSTGTPTTAAQACRYQIVNNQIVIFEMEISSVDGKAASQLTATLPILPWVSCDIPVRAESTIDGAKAKQLGYIDAGNGTEESRLLTFRSFTAWTNTKACSIIIRGWYPIAPMVAWSPTSTWTTSPATQTVVALYQQIGDLVFFVYSTLSSDGNTSSALTVSLPTCGLSLDLNTYVKCVGIQKNNTSSFTDIMPYVDQTADTVAARLLKFDNFITHTDNTPHSEIVSGWYFINSATDFSARLGATWTTGTPASLTKKAHYTVLGDFVFFSIYLTSADSNGCTALTLNPPFVPLKGTTKLILGGYELNNATPVECLPCLQAQETDPADRIIEFDNFTTCTDAATVTVKVSGMYKIAG